MKHSPLNVDTCEMRFLVVAPHGGEPNKPLECFFSYESLETCTPYTYVANSRGNPAFKSVLSIDGFGKWITTNIRLFLETIRMDKTPIRLWFRDYCLDQSNPDEVSRYWTAQWMQTMSTHSSDIFDLSELMGVLWDQNKLAKPHSPRCKTWYGTREFTSPKHFPMPIASWRGWNAPLTKFQHLRLDYFADEIRLIELFSAQEKSSRLIAGLGYTPMNDDTTYHALSYTWGDEDASHEILLNGQIFMIRKNLDNCLRAVRHPKTKIVLWVDAICIDQNNVLERNRQLPRMLEI